MGRKGAAERRRLRLGLPPVKPGKIGWVHGTKLTFFEGFREEFLAAAEIGRTGAFYSGMAKKYLQKYGYNTPWEGDLEDGQTVADDVDPDQDINSLSKEEGEERAEYYTKLRGKIGVWFHGRYGGSVEKKQKKVSFRTIFDKPELDPPQPVKARTLHYYSHRFYEERVKPRFLARWAAVSRLPNPPAVVTLRNKVTREAWEAESDEFKAEVLAAREADHQHALDAYSMAVSAEPPTTAEEYNVALNNAAYYLQPFADSAHERFGMNIVILMCGPVPDRGGRIEVRSIHSGKSNGLVPRIWAEADRAGFDAAQRSFAEFTHQCFTEAECRARSLNGMAMDEDDPSPSSNDAPTSSTPNDRSMSSSSSDGPTSAPLNGGEPSPSANDAPTSPTTNEPARADQNAAQPSQPEADAAARTTLRYDPLDPELDALLRPLDLELSSGGSSSGASVFNFEGPFGSGFGGGFDGGFAGGFDGGFDGGLGYDSGDNMPPAREEEQLPPLNLTNRDEREEEVPGNKSVSPSHAAAAAAPPPPRPKPKPAYRGAAAPAQVSPPNSAELVRNAEDGPDRGGEDEEGSNGGSLWREQEMTDWPEELQKAFAGFARGKSWGGEEWESCVTELIALESAWGFPNKGLLAVPNSAGDRPSEIEKFMRYGRKWGSKMELGEAIGPCALEETFSHRWWDWWTLVQPEGRKLANGDLRRADEVATKDWEEIAKMAGRNGVLLYMGGLLWWGEAAAAAPESEDLLKDWRLAVDDVAAVLRGAREAVDTNGQKAAKAKATTSKKGAATRSSKRKNPDVFSNADKENEPLRKRTRSSR